MNDMSLNITTVDINTTYYTRHTLPANCNIKENLTITTVLQKGENVSPLQNHLDNVAKLDSGA